MLEGISIDAVGALVVSALFGGMVFFSFVMAPLIFSKLPADAAGTFIRQVFPVYYLVMGSLAALALALLLMAAGTAWSINVALLGVVTLGFLLARQFLMPRINLHRDRQLSGDARAGSRFKALHAASVAVNLGQMVAAAAVLLRLNAVT